MMNRGLKNKYYLDNYVNINRGIANGEQLESLDFGVNLWRLLWINGKL